MSLLARFEKQLAARGLTIKYEGGEKFLLNGPTEEQTPEIMAACKAMKPLLIEKYAKRANDPANAVQAELVVPPGEKKAPAQEAVTGPAECKMCNAIVEPRSMKEMSFGIWMQTCGAGNCAHKATDQLPMPPMPEIGLTDSPSENSSNSTVEPKWKSKSAKPKLFQSDT